MKILPVFFLLTLCSALAFGSEKVNGYYISKSGDTVQVSFELKVSGPKKKPSLDFFQYGPKYYNASGKKDKLKPSEAKEIFFEWNNESYHLISLKVPDFLSLYYDDYFFLRLIVNGPLKLYYHYISGGFSAPTFSPNVGGRDNYTSPEGAVMVYEDSTGGGIILQKDTHALFVPRRLHFKGDVSDYLSNCPIANKVRDKVYGKDDIESIVKEYNLTCGKE